MHLLVLIIVCLFAVAGFWQLHRLRERRADNALVTQRRMATATSLDEARVHYRARLTGHYDVANEVVLRGRGIEGRPGDHLLTPLRVDGGRAVLVDRGWVLQPTDDATAPDGEVEVTGYLLPSEGAAPLGGSGSGRIEEIARIDVERLDAQIPYDLEADYYLLLQEQDPPQPELPRPVPPLKLSEGSHLSYAGQWFLFIPIALGGYAAILRREAKKRATRLPSPADD
jgi:surfeit locus 1 family protein